MSGGFEKNLQYYKFCLYGFFKNLRFFEAFLLLFFLDKGLTFLEISDYLNTSKYIPQRTDKFTSQQVFGLFDKMNKRIKRLQKITPPKIYNFGILHTSKEHYLNIKKG